MRSGHSRGRRAPAREHRWLRFFLAVAALLAVIVGIPVGLAAMSQIGLASWHPLPGIGTAEEIREYFERELTATEIAPIILRVLLAACWLLWASLAASVLAAVFSTRPRLGRIRLPRPAMFDSLGVWIAAGLTSLSSFTPNLAAATGGAPSPAPVVFQVDSSESNSLAAGDPGLVSVRPGYERVVHGESIEMFAARTLGDAGRWREIWALNEGRVMDEVGTTWSEPWRLAGGWQLELPARQTDRDQSRSGVVTDTAQAATGHVAAPSTESRTAPADVKTYEVQMGDGPWDVAEALLGDGMRYQEVLDANVGHEVAPGRVWTSDQRMIHPGWVFSWGPGIEPKPVIADSGGDRETDAAGQAETREVRVTVESGDTLWRLVDEHSGRGVDRREVERVAARNDGVATPDGSFSFDASNPDLVHPGQEFVIEQTSRQPSDDQQRTGPSSNGDSGGDSDAADERVLGQGSDLADPPTDHGEGPGDRHDTQDDTANQPEVDTDLGANADTTAGDGSVDVPGEVEATERSLSDIPNDDAGAGRGAHAPPSSQVDVSGSSAHDGRSTTTPTTTEPAFAGGDSASPGMSVPGPVELGMGALALSAGVLTLLEVSRRRRLRSAQVRDRLRTHPPEVASTERQLRQLGDGERLVRADMAVRAAVEPLLAAGRQVAAVVTERNGNVTLCTDGPVTMAAPWNAGDDSRRRWTMPPSVDPETLAASGSLRGAPCPALTPIGTSPAGGDVLIDVECAGILWLDLAGSETDRVLRGICAGLGSSIFAESASLVGVGVDQDWFLDHPNSHTVDSVVEAATLAAQLAGPAVTSSETTFALRAKGTSGESWQPAVVVVGAEHAAQMAGWRPMPGVAVVVAAPPEHVNRSAAVGAAGDRWVLRPATEGAASADAATMWQLDPLGLTLLPVGLSAHEFTAIDELLTWERAPAQPVPTDPDVAPHVTAPQDPEAASRAPSSKGEQHPLRWRTDQAAAAGESAADGRSGAADPAGGSEPSMVPAADATRSTDDASHLDDEPVASDTLATGVAPTADAGPPVDAVTLATDVPEPAAGADAGGITGRPVDDGRSVETPGGRVNGHRDSADRVGASSSAVVSDEAPVAGSPEPEWSLMVRVFGLVDVVDRTGNAAQFSKSKSLELLTWLVLHRDRATRAGARSALWEVDVRDATFANVVSEARRGMNGLLAAPDGEEWLGRTLSTGLPLHDRIICDADLIESQLERARSQAPALAIETLRPAVELIRGLPFAETGYLWPDAEGITSHLVILATSATSELAELMLAAGDADGVFWATGVGLQVLAGHEDLIALRMRAHAARRDRAGIRQEWEAYERVLVADTWSDGEPSPKLVDLRKELLNGPASAARPSSESER